MVDKCHPLINHCIAQALAVQHPEIVKQIKATCKMFPCSARGLPSRPATITQLIADLDPDQENSFSESPHSDSIDHFCSPELTDPEAYYGQAGTPLVSFHDSPTSSAHLEDPRRVISPPNPKHHIPRVPR
jgi:hypothetical protein